MILDKPEDIFYLTGFWGEGILVILETFSKLIVPKLEDPTRFKNVQGL